MITIEEQMKNDTLKFIKLINKLLDNHRKKEKLKNIGKKRFSNLYHMINQKSHISDK